MFQLHSIRFFAIHSVIGTTLLLSVSLGFSQSDSPENRPNASQNAALLYHLAFSYHEDLYAIFGSDKTFEVRQKIKSGNYDEETEEYWEIVDSNLDHFHEAAKRSYCDWGIESNHPAMGRISSQMRSLSTLLIDRFRYRIKEGAENAALHDFMAVRRAVEDLVIQYLLISHDIHAYAIEQVAIELPDLNNQTLKKLKAFMREQRKFEWSLDEWAQEQVKAKRRFLQAVRRKLQKAVKTADLGEFEQFLPKAYRLDDPPFASKTPKELRNALTPPYEFFDALQRLSKIEESEDFNKEAKKFVRTVKEKYRDDPAARLGLFQIEPQWERHKRVQILRKAFDAALIAVSEGIAAARDVPDPGGDGPFEIEKHSWGFAIQSSFAPSDGEPVILHVGNREGAGNDQTDR